MPGCCHACRPAGHNGPCRPEGDTQHRLDWLRKFRHCHRSVRSRTSLRISHTPFHTPCACLNHLSHSRSPCNAYRAPRAHRQPHLNAGMRSYTPAGRRQHTQSHAAMAQLQVTAQIHLQPDATATSSLHRLCTRLNTPVPSTRFIGGTRHVRPLVLPRQAYQHESGNYQHKGAGAGTQQPRLPVTLRRPPRPPHRPRPHP